MLDMDRIAGGEIGGLDSTELSFLEDLLGAGNDNTIFNQWTGLPDDVDFNEFVELNDNQLREIQELESEAKSKNTERQTTNYVKLLKRFLLENNLPENIEDMPIRYLEAYLRLFFTKIRKRDGECYSTSSLVCMRAAFHRYLSEKRHLQIIDNPDFCALDKTFKASITTSLRCNEKHISEGGSGFPSIDEDDMKKLRHYFNRMTPQKLQDEVFFIVVYHFGFRGREWLRSLVKSSFVICDNGPDTYIDLVHSLKEKNVKVGDVKTSRQIIMTEISNKDYCPVEAVKLYLSKLPGNTLFPKCRVKWDATSWFCENQVLGKNVLNGMMKAISKRAELNREYTNHCIRSTVVTTLKRRGFDDASCMSVTGHKSITSIERYDKRRISEKMTFTEKKKISQALSEGFCFKATTSTTHLESQINLNSQDPHVLSSSKALIVDGCTFVAPKTKTMKITADGERNVVSITFE